MMIMLDELFWYETIRNALITIISTFIAVYISIYLHEKREKEERRKIHFNRIKLEVLKPLKETDKLSFLKTFWGKKINHEKVNVPLFEDLTRHFPNIIKLNKRIEDLEEERNNLVRGFIEKLKEKYKLEEIYTHLFYFYLLHPELEYYQPKVEGNEVRCSTAIYTKGNKNSLITRFIQELKEYHKSEDIKKLKDIIDKIEVDFTSFKREINLVLGKEKLPGNCDFI